MALPSLLEHLQVNTITPLRFSSTGPVPKLPVLVQHHLMRIAREAVNNALKYSKASSVEVSLEATGGRLALAITDEGAGFDVDAALTMEGHFGLRGMLERGRKIGAELQVISAPGKGTRITGSLDLPTKQTG
jgi:signal transduction histidine kinase